MFCFSLCLCHPVGQVVLFGGQFVFSFLFLISYQLIEVSLSSGVILSCLPLDFSRAGHVHSLEPFVYVDQLFLEELQWFQNDPLIVSELKNVFSLPSLWESAWVTWLETSSFKSAGTGAFRLHVVQSSYQLCHDMIKATKLVFCVLRCAIWYKEVSSKRKRFSFFLFSIWWDNRITFCTGQYLQHPWQCTWLQWSTQS